MKVAKGDLFSQKCDAICITTNGYYTMKGEAVMGKGVAAQASAKWKVLKQKLGYMLNLHGSHVFIILKRSKQNDRPYYVVNFPTKKQAGKSNGKNVLRRLRNTPGFMKGDLVPGWALKADIELIAQSAREIVELAKLRGWQKVIIPRPGCGNGELTWAEVRAVIKPILRGPKFIVIDHIEE